MWARDGQGELKLSTNTRCTGALHTSKRPKDPGKESGVPIAWQKSSPAHWKTLEDHGNSLMQRRGNSLSCRSNIQRSKSTKKTRHIASHLKSTVTNIHWYGMVWVTSRAAMLLF